MQIIRALISTRMKTKSQREKNTRNEKPQKQNINAVKYDEKILRKLKGKVFWKKIILRSVTDIEILLNMCG